MRNTILGFFMAKSFVVCILAFALLLMAVIKFAMHQRNVSPSKPITTISAGHQPVWINKSLVSIHRKHLGHESRLQDIFLLKQRASSGEACSFGLFRVVKMNEEKVVLKFVGSRIRSRFDIWAESQGKTIAWEWQLIKGSDFSTSPGQQCWLWRKDEKVQEQPLIVISRSRFFIRGSRYAEIVEAGNGRFKVDSDHIREGWWVTPVHPNSKGTLILRSARTGFLESLPIEFRDKPDKGKSQKSPRIQSREFRKSFALPGWE